MPELVGRRFCSPGKLVEHVLGPYDTAVDSVHGLESAFTSSIK